LLYISVVETNETSKNWYVVYTQTNAEKRVEERLAQAGFEVYLPLYESLRQWSDRKKKVKLPLISSVVFVHSSAQMLNDVYTIQGVKGILKQLGQPAVVQGYEICNLQRLLQDSTPVEASFGSFRNGQNVAVVAGPFKGMHAKAIETLNAYRVAVSLELIGVAYVVNIPKSDIQVL
jgi:transcription antitermination factor NusG